MRKVWRYLSFAILIFACTAGPVRAQATAQIGGRVTDQSGAVMPGVEITVTQADTGISRNTITNETGSYVLTNLPIGPYRLEASLPGFRTFAQTGIVLQVNSSPSVNVVLEVGQVAETIEVQANAALVETRNVGVGATMENTRILELPLNGRQMIELVALSGAAAPAPALDGSGGRDPFTKVSLSVAGGMSIGLNYTLDGAYHINPYTASYQSMPFPDALQEFKLETSATNAQRGLKSAGSVSLVTKSGTNEFHGNLFEFVRNGAFNARNALAAQRDTIKRHQFGGTIGGPIVSNRLFFFGGYQGTTIRQAPSDVLGIVPTPAMRTGDFTTFASPACNGGRQINLNAPFVNNRIDPAQFSRPAMLIVSKLPTPTDACGRILYTAPNVEDGHMAIGRIDYQQSANHSIFGRYLLDKVEVPAPYDVERNIMNSLETSKLGLSQAFSLGDTYLFGTNTVNAFRITANRIAANKGHADYDDAGIGLGDVGVNSFTYDPHRPFVGITGGLGPSGWAPTGSNLYGKTNSAAFAVNDDVSIVRGDHQLSFGAQIVAWWANSYSSANSEGSISFNGQTTGLGFADFFIGRASSFQMSTTSGQNKGQKHLGLYFADTWNVRPNLTLNYGLRWEPYFPQLNLDGGAIHFNIDEWRKGTKTQRFVNAPEGASFEGDPGFPGPAGLYKKWGNFSPRLGLAWDVSGDGRTSVRASGGLFYDFPNSLFMQGLINGSPTGSPRVQLTNVTLENPWASYPGGNPHPMGSGRALAGDFAWPLFSSIDGMDFDTPNMQVSSWNLSIQRQFGTDWMVSASYLGNTTTHVWSLRQLNPAVFLGLGPCTLHGVQYSTCSTTANQNQRRRLSLENYAKAQKVSFISTVDSGGKALYNGLLLSVQRRAAQNLTVSANYTWSRCITDPYTASTHGGFSGEGWTDPDNRSRERGNCADGAADRRQMFNLSAVAETPEFANRGLRVIASGWRFSPIFRALSGDHLTVTTSQDRALNAVTGQRVNQLLLDPYGNKTIQNYLNPAAFAMPALGTLGNLGRASIVGPGMWQFDMALSRTFQLREAQRLEFRAEAFNVTNSVILDNPTTNFNSSLFGQVTSVKDPRIMQFALKYVF
jgi:hypothetical protein